MPILIDGNNLLHTLPSSMRDRHELRRLCLDLVRREGMQLTVVFDGGPPSGAPLRESLGRLTVVYSDTATADDVIVRALPSGNAARNWTVVTDDNHLRNRCRGRGARVLGVSSWRGKLLSAQQTPTEDGLSPQQVADWESYFSGKTKDQN